MVKTLDPLDARGLKRGGYGRVQVSTSRVAVLPSPAAISASQTYIPGKNSRPAKTHSAASPSTQGSAGAQVAAAPGLTDSARHSARGDPSAEEKPANAAHAASSVDAADGGGGNAVVWGVALGGVATAVALRCGGVRWAAGCAVACTLVGVSLGAGASRGHAGDAAACCSANDAQKGGGSCQAQDCCGSGSAAETSASSACCS